MQRLSLIQRIMLFCLPAGLLLVGVTCYHGFSTSQDYVKAAIERNVKMRSVVISRTMEAFIDKCIQDVRYLDLGSVDPERLRDFMTRRAQISPGLYRQAAYISSSSRILVVEAHREVRVVAAERFGEVEPNPLLLPDSLPALADGEVYVAPIVMTQFPFHAPDRISDIVRFSALRFIIRHHAPDGSSGYLMLAVDAQFLRRELTRSTSSDSRAWGFDRSNEVRFSYLVNTEGWILMQSVVAEQNRELPTFLARAGFFGTLGKRGLPNSFLPDKRHSGYWKIMESLRAGQSGFLTKGDGEHHESPDVPDYFLAYEPVTYSSGSGEQRQFLFGLFYIDRSRLASWAQQAFLFNALAWGGGVLLLLVMFVLVTYRVAVRPLARVRDAFRQRIESGDRSPLPDAQEYSEISRLVVCANQLLKKLELSEKRLESVTDDPMSEEMRQPVHLEREYQHALLASPDFPEFIGMSSALVGLKEQIVRAAQTGVDVFIVGETGTGKQLIAEAIHRLSARSGGPFVAINCGALNENLLLDTLFGHVRGAHSGADTDRKGAFIEASGGTLFLDEIQTASPRVQQALLRAIAERKVLPLGSDQELAVDLRLVTATNTDLLQLIRTGEFREDLFYRLYVLTIQTLPLRMHKEDIPLLAYHFLKQTQEILGKPDLQFSKGALKVLLDHDWPGNVRELVNSITRSVVFARGQVVEAGDLRMEDPELYTEENLPEDGPSESAGSAAAAQPDADGRSPDPHIPPHPSGGLRDAVSGGPEHDALSFSPRQLRALGYILERKMITRKEYQRLVGDNLPARTANYDLNDFMQKGVLVREGQGAGTRYRLAGNADIRALRETYAELGPGEESPRTQKRPRYS